MLLRGRTHQYIMTIEDYKTLPEQKKKEILVDAHKVGEVNDEYGRRELYQVDNFYVEVFINFVKHFRKILDIYSVKDIPSLYRNNQ